MQSSTTKTKFRRAITAVLCCAMLFLGYLCFFSGRFYVSTFGRLGFDSVLYTLSAGLQGVQSGQITGFLFQSLLPTVLATALTVWLLMRQPWHRRKGKYESGRISRKFTCWCSALLSLGLILLAAFDVELVAYVLHQNANTGLYQAEYVDPDKTKITFPDEKRNLIYIMLESMETSYLSKDLGGAMEENLIPELYQLAEKNLCFSNTAAKVGRLPRSRHHHCNPKITRAAAHRQSVSLDT